MRMKLYILEDEVRILQHLLQVVNAIPYVCAAAPGIRTTLDLPQIIADLGEAPTFH